LRIAIHHRKGSFSDRWIEYCNKHKIGHKIVNCYDSDIIDQLKDCDGLMWHWSHTDYRDLRCALPIIRSLEDMGKLVFPSYSTCWHFNDKVAQKYLLETIGAPLVKSYVFYDNETASEWIDRADFPKVFKLRGGAGSLNVSLVRDRRQAHRLVNKMFGRGINSNNNVSKLNDRWHKLLHNKDRSSFYAFVRAIVLNAYPQISIDRRYTANDTGYAYFQDFIPNNTFDDRIVVLGNRAIFLRRFTRKGDFRASGSGLFDYNPSLISKDSLKTAFEVSRKINAQSLAYDFVYTESGNPQIVEISYAYSMGKAYDDCPGYWDSDLNWHEVPVDPQRFIIEDFIKAIDSHKIDF